MPIHLKPEPELLSAFRESRDEAAFRELVRRHLPMVIHVALRRLGDRGAAEEAAQNVFLKLARKAPTLDPESVVGAWLHRVTVQETIDFHRKEFRRRRAMKNYQHQVAADQSAPEPPPADHPLLAGLDDALDKLSTTERAVVMLRFQSGMRFGEIAERLGKSEEAARKQLARALEKLARKLCRRQGGTVSAAAITAILPLAVRPSAGASPAAVAAVGDAALTASAAPLAPTNLVLQTIMNTKTALLVGTATAVFLASFVAGRHTASGFERKLVEETLRSTNYRDALAGRTGRTASRPEAPVGESTVPNKTVAQIIQEAAALVRRGDAGSPAHYRLRLILDELEPADYETAITHLEALRSEGRVFERLAPLLAGLWAYEDGEAAIGWVEANLGASKGVAISNVLGAWSETDPEAAYQRYQTMAAEGGAGMHLMSFRWLAKGIFAGWVRRDPEGALAALNGVAAEDEDEAVFGIASAVTSSSDPQPILDAIGAMPDIPIRHQLVRKVASGWAGEEPYSAAAWVDTVPMPNAKARMMARGQVAEKWMRQESSDLISIGAWLLAGAPEDMRDQIAELVAQEIVRREKDER